MPSPALGRLRQTWFTVHLWIGVILTLLLAPLGVTGSVLVWRQALAQPPGVTGPVKLPLSAYVAAGVGAAGGEGRVTAVRLPDHDGAAVSVQVRPRTPEGAAPAAGPRVRPPQVQVWLDPATGHVLRVDRGQGGMLGPVHQFHETFLAGDLGRPIVGVCGIAMLISSLTGLWLWWPRGGGVPAAFRWRRTGWTLLNLHHVVGFWLCVPLAVLSLTGAALSFPDATRMILGQPLAPQSPPRRDAAPGEGRHEGGHRDGGARQGGGGPSAAEAIDAVAAGLRTRHPNERLTSLSLPTRDAPGWRAQFLNAAGQPFAVKVDPATGAETPAPPAGGDDARRLIHKLHGGEQTGIVWQVIITIAGLAPTLLGVTGIVVWLRRRRLKAV